MKETVIPAKAGIQRWACMPLMFVPPGHNLGLTFRQEAGYHGTVSSYTPAMNPGVTGRQTKKRGRKMTEMLAEMVGTMVLILFGEGVVANVVLKKSKAENAGWMVVTTAWAIGVAMGVYAVGRISGAHLNPAVTIAMASLGSFPWAQVPGYILAQMVGAFLGAVLVWAAFLAHWEGTPDADAKLSIFATSPAIRRPAANFLTEMIGAAILLFGILSIAANAQNITTPGAINLALVFSHGLQPALVGVLVWGIGLSLGGPTGYAINPARDLAPRLAHALLPIPGKRDSDWGYSWVPVLGPIAGGLLGAWFFRLTGF
jgi:glycerol uptake facilitator protein